MSTANTSKHVRAHVIVDAINAFASEEFGGELPVPEGELIGQEILKLQNSGIYATTVAGNDTHPEDMFNFADVAGDVSTVKDANGEDAPVFPRHAVAGTWGCEFLPDIDPEKVDRIFPKGDQPGLDSFSACGNPELVEYLNAKLVTHVDVTGLVLRICVAYTAIDLAKAGFKVRVITSATRDLELDAFKHKLDEMREAGVELVSDVDTAIATA